ncbi:hypothetical protein M595_3635 [Lyngbya aestuarii BL J]|uniref:Myosin heavy chain n=1 Tax=Lyngbya aestuarii BL J TaxID=1348334 RepID=U7QH43_9CYAN|nr:hypothetical protein [Lyngbya aestuarii]ERT06375.1 hypothetical protein M595_3635 [Lyngbya aestuarii BL J]
MESTIQNSKTQIISKFQQILEQRKKVDSKISTKEEEAEKEKGKELLNKTSAYTVDSIVKNLADLQLSFGNNIVEISEQLKTESSKLEELKRSIEIETQQLQELQKIRVVADALYLLSQEHQEKLSLLTQNATQRQETLDKDKIAKRKAWEQEQSNFEATVQQQQEELVNIRQQEEENYNYELEKTRKIEQDEYEETRRKLERELTNTTQEKEKNWSEREEILEKHKVEFEANKKKAEGFEDELKKAYVKAKEEAIQDANREAKVKADLFEKEWESTKQGYELQVTSLEQTIQRQNEQIADLSAQLQATIKQAQDLAMRAFASSSSQK